QGGQFGPVGHGERDVCAAAGAGRPAIGFRREASVRQEPDVERGQLKFLTAPCIGPAESLRDCDVDRQGAHVGGNVAAHGRMLTRPRTGYVAAYRASFAAMRRLQLTSPSRTGATAALEVIPIDSMTLSDMG